MNIINMDKKISLSYADIISFISAFLGFAAIIIIYRLGDFYMPAILLIVSALLDFVDGKVARYFNQAGEFGKNIDSLADIVAFGVAPAVFCQQFLSGYAAFIPFLIVLAGIYRLARFNVIKSKDFMGMPITLNGIIIPVVFLLGLFSGIVAMLLSVILSALMVSKFKVKKYL
jgi:CDP-diacylglycerol--serine O-phosphatidyltransferase